MQRIREKKKTGTGMILYIQKPRRTTVKYLQSGRYNTETLPDTTGTHTDGLTNKRGGGFG